MSVLRGEAARRVLDRVSYNRRHASTGPAWLPRPDCDHLPAAVQPVPGNYVSAGSRPAALTLMLARAVEAGDA
jgi:hypothetical protein